MTPDSPVDRHTEPLDRHQYTALWWHFGPHGRQDVHLHSCFTPSCSAVLVGETRKCGSGVSHVERLSSTSRDHWSRRDHEGTPNQQGAN